MPSAQPGGSVTAATGVAAFLAVRAERRSLEDVAKPLTAAASAVRSSRGREPGSRPATA